MVGHARPNLGDNECAQAIACKTPGYLAMSVWVPLGENGCCSRWGEWWPRGREDGGRGAEWVPEGIFDSLLENKQDIFGLNCFDMRGSYMGADS